MIGKDLLKILACPDCRSGLKETGDKLLCTNPGCRRQYDVRNGIPIMLVEDSQVITHDAHKTLMHG